MDVVSFSSRHVPAEQRREVVESIYNGHVRTQIDFLGEAPVDIDMRLRGVGGVHIAFASTTPVTLTTPSDENEMLYLGISWGTGYQRAAGDTLYVKPGDVNVVRRDCATSTTVIEPGACLSIAIPRERIVPRLTSNDTLLRTLSLRDPAAHLLSSYAMALLDCGDGLPARDQMVFADHIADLAVLMLGARRDEGEGARRGGARAARLAAIKADIGKNLAHPDLSLRWIAARHRVSPAYVRALFTDAGTSFTDHVLGARLDRVRGLLRSPDMAHHTIASLALMAGFGDISWFNQAFRRRFGMTPSDFRAGMGK